MLLHRERRSQASQKLQTQQLSRLGLALLTTCTIIGFYQHRAQASEVMMPSHPPVPQSAATVPSSPGLADGVYLYGESSKPEQIGKNYMVFAVNHKQIVGAAYAPSSSFDCFQGSIQGTQLALTVRDSYSQETFSYQVAMNRSELVATAGNLPRNNALELEGYHRIPMVSQNDLRILKVCEAIYQGTPQP